MTPLFILGIILAFIAGLAVMATFASNMPDECAELSDKLTIAKIRCERYKRDADYWSEAYKSILNIATKRTNAIVRIQDLAKKCDLIAIDKACKDAIDGDDSVTDPDAQLLDWLQQNVGINFSFDFCTFLFPVPITCNSRVVREILTQAMRDAAKEERLNYHDAAISEQEKIT